MRIYRRVSAAWTRRLRPRAATDHLAASILPSRFDRGAIRCLSTPGASTVGPRSTRPRTQEPSISTAHSPGITLLQTMAEWSEHTDLSVGVRHQTVSHKKNPDIRELSRADLNRVLRDAIKNGDFVGAQRALDALLRQPNSVRTHPVDTETYDNLLYQWSQLVSRRRRRQREFIDLTPMLTLLEDMVAWKRVNMRSFNTALVACQRVHALDAAERVISLVRKSGRQPGSFAVTNLITCCARVVGKHADRQEHIVGLAERFLHELVTSGAGVTIEAVNAMLFTYRAARGQSKNAVGLVERALREWHLTPDKSTIATLVVCLLKDRNAIESARWIEFAFKQRVAVDDLIVRSVIDACRRSREWEKIDSLEILLQRHGIAQRDRELKKILKLKDRRDVASSSLTVLQGTPRDGSKSKKWKNNEASVLLRSAIRELTSGRSFTAERQTWNDIFTHGRIEDLDKLMQFLMSWTGECVSTEGVRQVWFNQMYLQALGAASQWWRVLSTLDEMLTKTPRDVDINCFNAALRSCTRAGRLNEALQVMERMQQRHMRPNRYSFDALIQCCGLVGSVEQAMQLFRDIERSGLKPTILDVNAVLKAHATAVQRLLDAAYSDDPELDVPASDLSKLAIHALQFYNDVTSHYEELVTTEATLVFLFRSFLGAAEVIDAVDMQDFEALYQGTSSLNRGSQPEWVLLSDVIQEVCRVAPLEIIPAHVINIGIDYYHRRGEPDQAFELFNTMIARGIAPTSDSIRLLFATCGSDDEGVQLGLSFIDYLLSDVDKDAQSVLPSVVANEALRWAGHSASTSSDKENDLIHQVFDKLVSAGILTLEASVYADVAAAFAVDGKVQETKQISRRMLQDTGSISLAVGNRVLQACSVARAPLAALDALEWLEGHGVQPDVMSYNSVLSAIRRRRVESYHETNDIEDEGGNDSDEEDYKEDDALGDGEGYANPKEGSLRKKLNPGKRLTQLEANLNDVVDKLLMTMEGRGVLPDAKSFENAFQISSHRQEMPRLLTLFDKIKATAQRRQVEISALLTGTTINHYLDACSFAAGVDPTEATGRVEELRSMLATWHKERDFEVPTSTLIRILTVYNVLGYWQEAVALLKNARESYGVAPSVDMFRAVMETCNDANQFKAVELVFVTMQKPGLEERVYPNAECYVEAIYAIEQQGDWIQATTLFMEMQKKCPAEDLRPALLNRIALGRYAEGRKHPN